MEWTKIKPKHFTYSSMSLSQRGALVSALCLTACLERMPTEKEFCKDINKTSLKLLENYLKTIGKSLESICKKVLEDCDKLEMKKSISSQTAKAYREKKKFGDVSRDTTEKRREEKRREEKSNRRFSPPLITEISVYCKERKNHVNATKFFDFYESKGWMVGKNKMKDWKASVRTWEEKSSSDGGVVKSTPAFEDMPEYKTNPKQKEEVSKMISKTLKDMK